MGFWQICTPLAAQNMITNPTPFIDITGYASSGTSYFARDVSRTRRSVASIGVIPTSGSIDGQVYYAITLLPNTTYAFSFDFLGAVGVPYIAQVYDVTATLMLSGSTTWIGSGYWAASRLSLVFTTPAVHTAYRLYVYKNNSNSTASFWTDGWQCETGSIPSTYIDGNQPGCSWDASQWVSTSTRSGSSRAGGQLVDLATYNLTVQQFVGTGMPPVQNVIPSYGLMDGGYFQRQKALPRNFALVSLINASTGSPGLNTYHASRKAFIDALKIDLVDQQQPFLLRYNNSQNLRAMWIRAYYQSGEEMNFIEQKGFTETMAPGFVCPDPFFYEEGLNCTSMGSGASVVASVSQILERLSSGSWTNMSGGTNGSILCFAPSPDGGMYVGGTFTNVGTGSISGSYCAQYLGGAWKPMGGGTNGSVQAIVIGPDGMVYALRFSGFTSSVELRGERMKPPPWPMSSMRNHPKPKVTIAIMIVFASLFFQLLLLIKKKIIG